MGKDLKGKELGSGLSQRKNGTYCARFVNRFGNRSCVYSRNLADLKNKLREAMKDDYTSTKTIEEEKVKPITLDEWYRKWIDAYKSVVRSSTKLQYCMVYEKHIKGALGDKLLTDITTLDIRALLADLAKEGLGYATQNRVRIMLLDMFDKAQIDYVVIRNPAKPVRLKKEFIERRVLSVEEQASFFNTCRGMFYEDAFLVHVLTGLRPGELFALTLSDIDFNRREINVDKTLLYQKLEGDEKKTFHLHPPKTEQSKRKVKFDDRCEKALRNQITRKYMLMSNPRLTPLPGFEDLLFVTTQNTPINAVIYSQAIERVTHIMNEGKPAPFTMETFSGHCFRHTYATRCFEAGMPPKTIQKQLGHASLKMTMDLYTHLSETKHDEDVKMVESYFDKILDTEEEHSSKVISYFEKFRAQ